MKNTQKGSLGLGIMFLLIVLGVFIIWVLVGGPTNKEKSTTKTKVIEKSVWPAPGEIPSYGPIVE